MPQSSYSPADIAALLPYFTKQEREFVSALISSDNALWRPLPGPQSMAYHSTADVIGYGGAAGGGKTDLAIGKALTQHRKVAIFRREATQLTGITDRITDLLGSRDGYNGSERIWRLPDVQLEFCSVPNPGDETKYQGRPKDLLVLDEAANFLEHQVRFLMGWVRTTDPGQRCQTLLTFNPPTSVEGRWIVDFFKPWLDKNYEGKRAAPGETRYFAMIAGKEVEVETPEPFQHGPDRIVPMSRTFIPSRVSDNIYLTGTGYMATLQALPEPLRSQMLYGDFEAGMTDDPWQVIPSEWVDIAMKRWTPRTPRPRMDGIGVDVARGGADNTIIARKHAGLWFDEALVYPGSATPNGPMAAGLVIGATRDRAPIHVDVVGVGAAVYDFLIEARQQTIGVNGAQASLNTDKSGKLNFANLKSYLWWAMREALDPDANTGIALPPDEQLRRDLCTPKWSLRGRTIHVMTREEMIKELGRSADWGSAYVMALMPTPRVADLPGALNRKTRDHNPYDLIGKG